MPLAEFAANNAESEVLKYSPFFANYGYNPSFGFKPQATLAMFDPPAQINAEEFANSMEDLCDYLKEEMAAAQAKYEDDANRRRELAPIINVGDKVRLDAWNIRIKRPSRKLDWKNLGRFKVKRKLNDWAYELELPKTIHIYLVFHVSLLNLCANNPLPD